MSSRDRPRDDDLEERLDELEDVLSELRRDLRREERERGGPLRPPRPPRLSELLRFTEQYTIPTLIALLETTIKSLELLRGTLRLADPGRGLDVDDRTDGAADRLADVRDGASAGLARSLSELRTALSEADLPEDAASRSIIEDARDLTAEIEDRIDEGRRAADRSRGRGTDERRDRRDGRDGRRGDGPRDDRRDARDDRRSERADDRRGGDEPDDDVVRIDVTDPDDRDAPGQNGSVEDGDENAGDGDAEDDREDVVDPSPEVDVESELESIKRQLDDGEETAAGDEDGTAAGDEDGTAAGDEDGTVARDDGEADEEGTGERDSADDDDPGDGR